jgi:hypothetical protein
MWSRWSFEVEVEDEDKERRMLRLPLRLNRGWSRKTCTYLSEFMYLN